MPDNLSPERRAMLERERAQLGSRAGFYDTKNLTDDYIRLLPIEETEPIGTKMVTYYLNKKGYICNAETHGVPGVISKTITALGKLGTPEALKMLEALKEARRYKILMKIITRKAPNAPKWFESPSAIYKVILNAFEKDGQVLYHPKTGRDIRISKEGSGKTSRYSAAVQDQSLLADTKEERLALKAAARDMDINALTAPNEAGALEALKVVIPEHLWEQIAYDVTGERTGGGSTRRAAPRDEEDDDDAPATRSGGALVDDEEDDEPKPQPRRSKAAVEEEADEVAPASARKRKASPPPDDDEEDEAPRAPANRRAAAPVVNDDEDEAPPAKAATRHRILDDED